MTSPSSAVSPIFCCKTRLGGSLNERRVSEDDACSHLHDAYTHMNSPAACLHNTSEVVDSENDNPRSRRHLTRVSDLSWFACAAYGTFYEDDEDEADDCVPISSTPDLASPTNSGDSMDITDSVMAFHGSQGPLDGSANFNSRERRFSKQCELSSDSRLLERHLLSSKQFARTSSTQEYAVHGPGAKRKRDLADTRRPSLNKAEKFPNPDLYRNYTLRKIRYSPEPAAKKPRFSRPAQLRPKSTVVDSFPLHAKYAKEPASLRKAKSLRSEASSHCHGPSRGETPMGSHWTYSKSDIYTSSSAYTRSTINQASQSSLASDSANISPRLSFAEQLRQRLTDVLEERVTKYGHGSNFSTTSSRANRNSVSDSTFAGYSASVSVSAEFISDSPASATAESKVALATDSNPSDIPAQADLSAGDLNFLRQLDSALLSVKQDAFRRLYYKDFQAVPNSRTYTDSLSSSDSGSPPGKLFSSSRPSSFLRDRFKLTSIGPASEATTSRYDMFDIIVTPRTQETTDAKSRSTKPEVLDAEILPRQEATTCPLQSVGLSSLSQSGNQRFSCSFVQAGPISTTSGLGHPTGACHHTVSPSHSTRQSSLQRMPNGSASFGRAGSFTSNVSSLSRMIIGAIQGGSIAQSRSRWSSITSTNDSTVSEVHTPDDNYRRSCSLAQAAIPQPIPIIAPPKYELIPRAPLSEEEAAERRLQILLVKEFREREADGLRSQPLSLGRVKSQDEYSITSTSEASERTLDGETARSNFSFDIEDDLKLEAIRWILHVLPRVASESDAQSTSSSSYELYDQLSTSSETRFHAAYLFVRYFWRLGSSTGESLSSTSPPKPDGADSALYGMYIPEGRKNAVWDIAVGCLALSVKLHRDFLYPLYPVYACGFVAIAPHVMYYDDLEAAQRDLMESFSYSLGSCTPSSYMEEIFAALLSLRRLLEFPRGWEVTKMQTWDYLLRALHEPDVLSFPLSLLTTSALIEGVIDVLVGKYENDGKTKKYLHGKDRQSSEGTLDKYERRAMKVSRDVVMDILELTGISNEDSSSCRRWLDDIINKD